MPDHPSERHNPRRVHIGSNRKTMASKPGETPEQISNPDAPLTGIDVVNLADASDEISPKTAIPLRPGTATSNRGSGKSADGSRASLIEDRPTTGSKSQLVPTHAPDAEADGTDDIPTKLSSSPTPALLPLPPLPTSSRVAGQAGNPVASSDRTNVFTEKDADDADEPLTEIEATVERIVNAAPSLSVNGGVLAPDVSTGDAVGTSSPDQVQTVTIGGVEMRLRSDDEIERAENEALMDPDDPLLGRVQSTLRASLTNYLNRLTSLLTSKQHSLTASRARREDTGARLYTLQSELVRAQEKAQAQVEEMERQRLGREDGERRREETRRVWKEVGSRVDQQERNVAAHRTEHAALLSSLHTLALHLGSLSSQTSVAKTTALKTERDLTSLESSKLAQDLYLDRLTLQLRTLEDQKAILTRQLELQQAETRRAKETVQEAEVEAEALGYEMSRLRGEWRRAVQGVERRDGVAKEVAEGVA
ncbi:Coiled-coil domain-containing protein 40, partial [Gonapodya sp. JEL0774]